MRVKLYSFVEKNDAGTHVAAYDADTNELRLARFYQSIEGEIIYDQYTAQNQATYDLSRIFRCTIEVIQNERLYRW